MDYKKIFTNKKSRINLLNFLSFIPDSLMLRIEYLIRVGKSLDLARPQYYTEKIQWLKLYNRNPNYTVMVDKFAAKDFIRDKVGEKYVVPTLGVWDRSDLIDFNTLPNQFVLKCTHDSGSIIICNQKDTFDEKAAKESLDFHLRSDGYILGREWPYKNVPRKIIAEPLLINNDYEIDFGVKDFKFFCFGGEPKLMYISNDKSDDPRTDFFDMDFNHLPIRMKDPSADCIPQKPSNFDEMKQIAGKLSEGIPHLRVDFYTLNSKIYVGEMTFFHNSGFTAVQPEEWDLKMGEWIVLPSKEK